MYARREEPKILVRNHGGRPESTGRFRTNAGRLCPGGMPTYVSPGIMHSVGGIPRRGGLGKVRILHIEIIPGSKAEYPIIAGPYISASWTLMDWTSLPTLSVGLCNAHAQVLKLAASDSLECNRKKISLQGIERGQEDNASMSCSSKYDDTGG